MDRTEVEAHDRAEEGFEIPGDVRYLIRALENAGFEAYTVGGCVRDLLLGLKPHDWDICTSAAPDEIQRVFSSRRMNLAGLKHGTVSVIISSVMYEITTYRTDGTYSDHRHPDGVRFVRELREDLARRDFTINAMAYSPSGGLQDPFDGRSDLRCGRIRCVGRADERFGEDALRMLRALRFSSRFGFPLEEETAEAIRRRAKEIHMVAAERIHAELFRMLEGKNCRYAMAACRELMEQILPSLSGLSRDEYDDLTDKCDAAGCQPLIRMALMLSLSCRGGDGEAALVAGNAMESLRSSRAETETVAFLVGNRSLILPEDRKAMHRLLLDIPEDRLRCLMRFQALLRSEDPIVWNRRYQALDLCLAEHPPLSIRDLDIRGTEVAGALNIQGARIGKILRRMLEMVASEEVPNRKEELLKAGERMIHEED